MTRPDPFRPPDAPRRSPRLTVTYERQPPPPPFLPREPADAKPQTQTEDPTPTPERTADDPPRP